LNIDDYITAESHGGSDDLPDGEGKDAHHKIIDVYVQGGMHVAAHEVTDDR